MTLMRQEAAIEAVLFAAGDPVPLQTLADAVDQDVKTAKKLVLSLSDKYAAENRGFLVMEVDGAYQMRTNPDYFEFVSRTARKIRKKPLSQAALETLAIIAYRQPITKAEIEEIRGVDSGHAVNKLLECGLVVEKGRRDVPGKPILFATTDAFLTHFGLTSLADMPDLDSDVERLKREVEEEMSLPIHELQNHEL